MTKTEELTLKLIEGTLTEEQRHELEWLVETDAEAAEQHLALLDLEGTMRGLCRDLDLAESTMQQLKQRLAAKREAEAEASRDPLEDLQARVGSSGSAGAGAYHVQQVHRRRRRRRGVPAALIVILLLSIALVAFGLVIRNQRAQTERRPYTTADFVDFTGRVSILREEKRFVPESGSVLELGEGVSTGANSTATLRYDDTTTLKVGPDSTMYFEPALDGPRRMRQLRLEGGEVNVHTPRDAQTPPLTVRTPHALAKVGGTRFTVIAATGYTRLEVESGEVELTHLDSGKSIAVGREQYAIVEEGLPLVAKPIDAVERVSEQLVAFYRFTAGGGSTIYDASRFGEPLNLSIRHEGAVRWGKRSLRVVQPTVITTRGPATKVIEALTETNAITIEAWIRPQSTEQSGPAPIVNLAESGEYRNLTLAQGGRPDQDVPADSYGVYLRTTQTGGSGEPPLRSPAGSVADELVQLVYVKQADGRALLYQDTRVIAEGAQPGAMNLWSPNHPLSLASNPAGESPWQGEIRLLAIYNRALPIEEIQQNYNVGLTGDWVPPEQQAAEDDQAEWTEVYYSRGAGASRTDPFNVTAEQFRVRLQLESQDDQPYEEAVDVRLRSRTNPDEAQLLISTEETGFHKLPARFGAGEYIVEINGPDAAQWTIQVEQLE